MIFTITGPSGSGKTTLVKRLLREHSSSMTEILSTTTRQPRPGETGLEYHFVTREEFEQDLKADNFIEHVEFGGNYYGINRKDILAARFTSDNSVVIVDRKGAAALKAAYPDQVKSVYIKLAPESSMVRLSRRDGTAKALKRQKTDEKEGLFDLTGYDCVLDGSEKKHEVAYNFMNFVIAMNFVSLLDSKDKEPAMSEAV